MCNFPLGGSSKLRSGMTENISGFETVTSPNQILPWNWWLALHKLHVPKDEVSGFKGL